MPAQVEETQPGGERPCHHPEDLNARGTEGDAERLVDTFRWVKWHMCFAINMHTEMTRTVHAPAELIALEGPLQKSHRCAAERSRGKTLACGWREGTANRWDTILKGVVQLHVTPLGESWLNV
jgi:hypothetical protein